MSHDVLNGEQLKFLFGVGSSYFAKNVEYINSLNVFPVPDGDTGTNMNLTIKAGENALTSLTEQHFGKVIKELSRGMLLGARGNSGVILSQIWRGMSIELEECKTITTADFARGLKKGAEIAYKSVMKPVEGTILTVIRETAQDAVILSVEEKSFIPFLEKVIDAAIISLNNTPNLLPILKEVGAVDSGGQGLVTLFEGMLKALRGESVEVMAQSIKDAVQLDLKTFEYDDVHGEDDFGFCTEFIVRLKEPHAFSEENAREVLSKVGESLVVVHADDILKVHIHTETPLHVFSQFETLGEFLWIKAENMQEQFVQQQKKNSQTELKKELPKEKLPLAILAVASGTGIAAALKDMGATAIVDGGQTANPSTQDFLEVIQSIDADSYIILPNNSNIILAAEQVKSLTDKNITVVPTKTVPQGLAALIAYSPAKTLNENVETMQEAIKQVRSGEVTTAVRDTMLNGTEITSGSYISIYEKEIIASEENLQLATEKLIDKMIQEDSEIVTLIAGKDVHDEINERILSYLATTYPDVDVEYIKGNQDVYFYLVSVE